MQVSRWLETVFGAEGVPDFEVNTRTIDLLDQLVQISELRCKEVSLLIDDYRHKAAEYSSDGTTTLMAVINILIPLLYSLVYTKMTLILEKILAYVKYYNDNVLYSGIICLVYTSVNSSFQGKIDACSKVARSRRKVS